MASLSGRSKNPKNAARRRCHLCDAYLVLVTIEGAFGDFAQVWECRVGHPQRTHRLPRRSPAPIEVPSELRQDRSA
jgi:hypothetical protein